MLNTFLRMARTPPPFKKLTGAAIALPLHSETQVRAAPSPKRGCTAAEFLSCIPTLQSITDAVNSASIQKTFLIFCDKKAVVNKINFLQTKHTPPIQSDRIYGNVLSRIPHFQHANSATIHIAWIKAHASIHGNKIADRMAKWAATATVPNFTTSPECSQFVTCTVHLCSRNVHRLNIATSFPTPYTQIFLSPCHSCGIENPPSSSFPLSGGPMQSTVSKALHLFMTIQPRPCPFCNTSQPLDPISYITLCSSTFTSSLRNSIISTWPIPLLQQIRTVFLPFKPSMSTKNIQKKP